MSSHKNLASAKQGIMGEVGYCLKSQAKGLNYTFASETDLIAALRPAMIKHGVVVAPVNVVPQEFVTMETRKGTAMRLACVVVTYRFTHTESGDSEDVVVIGEGADYSDKAAACAMTMAFKYALRQAFMIETGDDPDKFKSQPSITAEQKIQRMKSAADAIANADSSSALEKIRNYYKSGNEGFGDSQIAELDAKYEKKMESVKQSEEAAKEGANEVS